LKSSLAQTNRFDNFKILVKNDSYSQSFDHTPFYNLFTFEKLDASKLIRDEVLWEVPDDAPHGFYQFYMSITSASEPENYVYLFDFYID